MSASKRQPNGPGTFKYWRRILISCWPACSKPTSNASDHGPAPAVSSPVRNWLMRDWPAWSTCSPAMSGSNGSRANPNMVEIYRHELTVTPDQIDRWGHVNNRVYLKWMEEAAVDHSDRKSTRLNSSH